MTKYESADEADFKDKVVPKLIDLILYGIDDMQRLLSHRNKYPLTRRKSMLEDQALENGLKRKSTDTIVNDSEKYHCGNLCIRNRREPSQHAQEVASRVSESQAEPPKAMDISDYTYNKLEKERLDKDWDEESTDAPPSYHSDEQSPVPYHAEEKPGVSEPLGSEVDRLLREENLPEPLFAKIVRVLTCKLRYNPRLAAQWIGPGVEKTASIRKAVYSVYEQMLVDIRSCDELARHAQSLFCMLTFAREKLSVWSFIWALELNWYEEEEAEEAEKLSRRNLNRILNHCGELVTVDDAENVVFSHSSVVDFFLQLSPVRFLDFSLQDKCKGHMEMTSLCLRSLCRLGNEKITPQDLEAKTDLHFLRYAVLHWADHMRHCEVPGRDIHSFCSNLFERRGTPAKECLRLEWEKIHQGYNPPFQGLVKLEKELSDETFDLETCPDQASFLIQKGLLHMVHPDPVSVISLRKVPTMSQRLSRALRLGCRAPPERVDTVIRRTKFAMDVVAQDPSGKSLLHHAASLGNLADVRYLIENGARADFLTPDGASPFYYALYNGREDVANWLIETGHAHLEQYKSKPVTSLHMAVTKNMLKAVKYLLEDKKVDVNVTALDQDWTPLIIAAETGREECAKLLLKNGADPWRKLANGNNALYQAVKNNHYGPCKVLFDCVPHLDPNVLLKDNITPLWTAADKGNLDIARLLVSKGAKFVPELDLGKFPMHAAAASGNVELVKFLAEHCPVDQKSYLDRQPIHAAADAGRLEVVKLLLEKGVDVNAKGFGPWDLGNVSPWVTPLVRAASNGHIEVAEYLIENGAEVSGIRSPTGRLLIHYAACCDKVDFARRLVEEYKQSPYSADSEGITAVRNAAYEGSLAVLKYFWSLERPFGVDINTQEYEGEGMLHYAARNANKEVVEFLLEEGADPNLDNGVGETPLMFALADQGIPSDKKIDLIRLMLSYGGNLNKQDFYGHTALHFAIRLNLGDVAQYLIDNGAMIDVVSYEGWTPLIMAAGQRNIAWTKKLIQLGADPRHVSKSGESVMAVCDGYPPFREIEELQPYLADYRRLSEDEKRARISEALRLHFTMPVYPMQRINEERKSFEINFVIFLGDFLLCMGRRSDAKIALEYSILVNRFNKPHSTLLCSACAKGCGETVRACAVCVEGVVVCGPCHKGLKKNEIFRTCVGDKEHDWILLEGEKWVNLPGAKVDGVRTFAQWMQDIRAEFSPDGGWI